MTYSQPPGQLYNVGSHLMHLDHMGQGSPVVVLDAGSGDSLLTWHSVQAEIADFTEVVAYDRSGMGWSERGPNSITPQSVAQELHQLLTVAGVKPPLIVVGHSLGGVYMRAFAHLYPEDVVGLILVDSSHESQHTRFAQAVPNSVQFSTDSLALLKDLSQLSHEEILEFYFKDADPTVPISDFEAMRRDRMRPAQLATVAEELTYAFDFGLKQPIEAIHNLADLPLTVLTATRPPRAPGLTEDDSQTMLKVFQELQTEISQRSTRSQQIFVPDAGHYIQQDKPEVVINAIRDMVNQVRADNDTTV